MSMAFAFRFLSLNNTAPHTNETSTEPRRTIDTIDIIALGSDSA